MKYILLGLSILGFLTCIIVSLNSKEEIGRYQAIAIPFDRNYSGWGTLPDYTIREYNVIILDTKTGKWNKSYGR